MSTTLDSARPAEAGPAGDQHRLHGMFAPQGIAIVGASDNSGWSRYTHANLLQGGYPHKIHVVNRKGGTVHGQAALTSLDEIGERVDLAYVLTGPASLPSVMEQSAANGIKNLVVIAAGFGETGPEGAKLERELAARATDLGLNLLGPNNLGYINMTASTMPWSMMVPWPLQAGKIGVLSQSGALGIFLLNYLQARDVSISHLVTVGNEAQLTVAEGMDYLLAQPEVDVIALYLESIRHTDVFIDVADRALVAGKAVVAYKAGRGEVGAKITAAHTGSLAGDDRVISALFRQHGVIRVDTIEDLVATSGLISNYGEIPGKRAAFVTGSGAMCGVIGDTAEEHGLELPDLAESTKKELTEIGLPAFATAQNPLDTTGYVVIDTNLLPNSEEVVSRDPGIDVLVVNGGLPPTPEAAQFMATNTEKRKALIAKSPVPVIVMDFLPGDRTPFAREYRRTENVAHAVDSFTRGIPALVKAMWWSEQRRAKRPPVQPVPVEAPPADAQGAWSERKVSGFLAEHGIPVVPQRLVRTMADLPDALEGLDFPVAMKISSPDIAHKTEVGGVALGLNSLDEARARMEKMLVDVKTAAPDAELEGVVVSPMRADGTDLLVGIVRDAAWGLTLVVGLGGIWVEVLQDSAVRVLPVTESDIVGMLRELRSLPLLQGARGTEPTDLDQLAAVIAKVADLAGSMAEHIDEIEINPLRVRGNDIEVLDALVRWRDPA